MIEFKKIRFKNFGSFGNNFSEIDLDTKKLTLVTGINGHGKSFAFLDSLTFALFGKPFRPINIPQLVNTVNDKNTIVEIEFTKGKTEYLVRRGLSPKLFEIFKDGKLIDQNAKSKDYQEMLEQTILGFSYSAFKQVVILGKSSFVPFMQLTPAERRKIIEGLLDLDIIAAMGTVVKCRLSELKTELQSSQSQLTISREKLKSQNEILKEIKQNYVDLLDKNEIKKIEITTKQTALNKAAADLSGRVKTTTDSLRTCQGKISKLKEIVTIQSKMQLQYEALLEDIKKAEEQTTCTCCEQDLSCEAKTKLLKSKYSKRDEYVTALEEISTKLQSLSELEDQKEVLENDLKQLTVDQSVTKKETQILQSRISEIEEEIDSLKSKHIDNNEIYDKIKATEKDIIAKTESYEKAVKEQIHYDVVYDMLRDSGLKSKIIKHYVPIINTLVNKYLDKLNLYVDFHLNEEFKETIKSRYRDEFSYASFSEGEKQRIDLAILMTWREVAKMKNSLNCNLLVFDEILDSSLDAMGTETFLKLLAKMKNKCSVFIISHKSDQLIDKFDQAVHVEKKNNFSRIKIV
jgi:DNA repair exonuclease SbcCD ATPase subunit